MGFSEGLEDEFLLTCFVCKAPFGMVAMFCGECGSRREQALGIEKAAVHQQIINNMPEAESYIEKAPDANVIPEYDEIFGQPGSAPKLVAAEIKPIKEHKLRNNIAIRTGKFNQFQQDHARTLNAAGLILFMAAIYMLVQNYMFLSSSPSESARDVLVQGVTRDAGYFSHNQSHKNINVFPSRYSVWKDQFLTKYVVTTSSNEWQGKATVSILPSKDNYYGVPISIKLKANYSSSNLIFRKIEWVVEDEPAILTIKYPTDAVYSIYINGLAAGTTANPAIKPGKYYVYPGPMEIKLFLNGQESGYNYVENIGTSGEYFNLM